MEILWQAPQLSVTEVEQKLQKNREIAHTTELTTLDRMHGNNLLLREKHGEAYVYSPRYSKNEIRRWLKKFAD